MTSVRFITDQLIFNIPISHTSIYHLNSFYRALFAYKRIHSLLCKNSPRGIAAFPLHTTEGPAGQFILSLFSLFLHSVSDSYQGATCFIDWIQSQFELFLFFKSQLICSGFCEVVGDSQS